MVMKKSCLFLERTFHSVRLRLRFFITMNGLYARMCIIHSSSFPEECMIHIRGCMGLIHVLTGCNYRKNISLKFVCVSGSGMWVI